MNPWLETLAVILLQGVAAAVGYGFSRLPGRQWLWGYCIPLAMLLVFHFAVQRPVLLLAPPASWIMMGRRKFAVVGIIATILLTTPMSRLKKRRLRILVGVMLARPGFALVRPSQKYQ